MKELFKRPVFLALFTILIALLGMEVATLRYSLAQRLISLDDTGPQPGSVGTFRVVSR